MVTVLLADDQPSVREGLRLRLALEPDLRVVGEAGDGMEALDRARRLKPDVVVIDVEMPRLDGVTATAALRAIAPQCAIVILTIHDDTPTRARADAAGATAFVAKAAGDAALIKAIRHAAALRKSGRT